MSCGGDDGVHRLADAPPPPDAAIDTTVDAPSDGMAVLTMGTTFAGGIGTLCGLAFDHTDNTVWAYGCSSATINHFAADGTPLGTIARPGEATDDVDVDVAPAAFTLGTSSVAAGDLMFTNGETGTADLYLPETSATVALATQFGNSHVVGGAFHVARNSIFVVQDRNGGAGANQVAELDPVTGAVRTMFSTLPAFDVNYGDIEVCQKTGNLFFVSSVETTLAEFTPAGVLVNEYPLPTGISNAERDRARGRDRRGMDREHQRQRRAHAPACPAALLPQERRRITTRATAAAPASATEVPSALPESVSLVASQRTISRSRLG